MIDDEQINNAIKRLALTGDGRLLHLMLQRSLMATCVDPTIPGALPLHEGGRRFASKLKELMDSSLAEASSGERAGSTSSERPIIVARPSGLSVAGSGGARRRVPDTAG